MQNRFEFDPESGFVFDRDTGEWLTTTTEVFDAMLPFLADNAKLSFKKRAKRSELHKSQTPCSAVEAFKIACKLAESLKDQCRYMVAIGEEPSELAQEALTEAEYAGYLPIDKT